jgi:hypothetical protein
MTKKKLAVTTDTAGPMNSLGKLLEVHGIMHVYCTDHVLKLTANKCFPPKRLVQGQDGCQDYHDILQEVARDLSKNFFTPHKPMMLCCKHKPKLDGTAAGTTDQCTNPTVLKTATIMILKQMHYVIVVRQRYTCTTAVPFLSCSNR